MPTPAPFFSIITPTHNVQFLAEAYASLLAQTDAPAWEWVILCNGKITTFDVHKALGFGDDGVPAPDHIRILRALKTQAHASARSNNTLSCKAKATG